MQKKLNRCNEKQKIKTNKAIGQKAQKFKKKLKNTKERKKRKILFVRRN